MLKSRKARNIHILRRIELFDFVLCTRLDNFFYAKSMTKEERDVLR